MTRRRGVRADEDEALRLLADGFAPVCTLVGKTWGLHLEKVVRVDRDENLRMIDESVAFLVGEGKTVVYDAEHFFDAWRDDPAYALRCAARRGRGRRRLGRRCATRTAPRSRTTSPRPPRRGASPRSARRVGIHCHNDAECGVANSLAAVRAGARHGAGHDERLRRALRQRQPRLDRPEPPAQDGLRRACPT